jgi:hypothetical protein
MSSNELLQVICKEIGLGFNTNIVETNDEMNWINTGSRNWEFMSEVVENSYISDEGFISASVDIYYNFNFVDIQKELSRDTSSDKSVSTNGLRDILGLPQTEETGPMILTSDNSLSGTNHYFSTWKILNRATDTALERGYSDDFVYYNADTKKTENFDVHSMTLNEGESMVLKGGKNDGAFFASNKNYVYAGKASNDNSHTNYNYSQTHNNRNISEAEKMAAELELPFPNYNIYKFQKVRVLFSHNVTTLSSPAFNSRYSGEWMVVDVKYVFYDGVFKQIISIIKREMSLTQDEIDRGFPNKPRPEGRGENKNPTPITNPSADGSGATASVNPLLRNQTNNNPLSRIVSIDSGDNLTGATQSGSRISNTTSAGTGNLVPSTRYKTSYPELPFTEPIPPPDVLPFNLAVRYLKSKYGDDLGKAVFAVLFAEASRNKDRTAFVSAGGHNYAGVQTDSGRWGATGIIGQYSRIDSGNNRRSFAIFSSGEAFLDFMADRVRKKGFSGFNGDIWTAVYINSWWSPAEKANYTKGTETYKNKLAIYISAMKRFNNFA